LNPPEDSKPPLQVGECPGIRGTPTGFFHAEEIEGVWWLVTPRGRGFFAVGTDHVNFEGHPCEKLGYAPYKVNNVAKYGGIEPWVDSTVTRLKSWGFNTLGWGHSETLRHRGLVYTQHMEMGAEFARSEDISPPVSWTGYPDVFSPNFAPHCDRIASECCADLVDDPQLIGYFIDNELEWFSKSRSDQGLFEEAIRKPADHPAKVGLLDFLKSRYGSVDDLNRAWGIDMDRFEELLDMDLAPGTGSARADAIDFLGEIAERYFTITSSAIRKYDPNHMVLGCRFGSSAPDIVWEVAGRHCDILSVNCYRRLDLEKEIIVDGFEDLMSRWHRLSGKPIMLTEWSFPALDAGLPCTHGAGQRVPTQKDRAKAFRIFQTTLFSTPFVVGSNYFMWVDEPEMGISEAFPEDSNYGLVNEHDDPYEELTATAKELNPRACEIHEVSKSPPRGKI
jgi:agarase